MGAKQKHMGRLIHGHNRGHRRTPEYRAWVGMLTRCRNANNPSFPGYGGRGISVHPEWEHSFAAFLRDVGLRPVPGYSIDRIDNDGNYEPGNVRWATRTTQARNRRSNRLTQDKVDAIRKARQDGWTYEQLAWLFGISIAHACDVCLRRAWVDRSEKQPGLAGVEEAP